ncbi:hypothetical protein C0J52_01258, partial [Blattella germanica]
IKEAFLSLSEAAEKVGLIVNEGKSKFIQITRRPLNEEKIEIGKYKFEIVQEFQYLGIIVMTDNNLDREIKNRIFLANRCYHSINNILKSKYMNLETKIALYKTLLRPS